MTQKFKDVWTINGAENMGKSGWHHFATMDDLFGDVYSYKDKLKAYENIEVVENILWRNKFICILIWKEAKILYDNIQKEHVYFLETGKIEAIFYK